MPKIQKPFSHLLLAAAALVVAAGCAQQMPEPPASSLDAEGGDQALVCRPDIQSRSLLVALEGGGAVMLDPKTGATRFTSDTGSNAFGAVFSADGTRAFITDKTAGTLSEIDRETGAVLSTTTVGTTPQQPAVRSDGRMFIPLAGDAAVAVVDINGAPSVLRRIPTGEGTKPHIVSLSPDERTLWVTVQGRDPKVLSVSITANGESAPVEYRYDLVPRVVAASNHGAWFTAHHSTGMHRVDLASGTVDTPYVDVNGSGSTPRAQIEGAAVSPDGSLVALTHEGRKVAVVLDVSASGAYNSFETPTLADKPYWVTLDPSNELMYVSIPGAGTVQAYDITGCGRTALWTAQLGGKAKRMAVTTFSSGANEPEPDPDPEHIVYFGRLEVQQGALQSALSREPRAGEAVTLRVFLPEVAAFVEGPYAFATVPHIFIRFRGDTDFAEAQGLPRASYNMRGPSVTWSESTADIALALPADADRVEVFAYFDRISYNGSTCYLAYDMTECPDSFPIDGDYVSNFGRNFRIGVRQ